MISLSSSFSTDCFKESKVEDSHSQSVFTKIALRPISVDGKCRRLNQYICCAVLDWTRNQSPPARKTMLAVPACTRMRCVPLKQNEADKVCLEAAACPLAAKACESCSFSLTPVTSLASQEEELFHWEDSVSSTSVACTEESDASFDYIYDQHCSDTHLKCRGISPFNWLPIANT